MNFIILVLISQTIKASVSIEDFFFDFLGEPSFESDTVSPGSQEQERGYMKNCYPNSSYNVSWVPKDLKPYDVPRIFISYTNPARFDTAEVTLDIKYSFFHGSKKMNGTCQDDLANRIRFIKCPVEKGGFMVKNYPQLVDNMVRLKYFKGTFKVKLKVENENGEDLFCGTIEANLV